jgi:mannose-6-phosphate isomerase-like protein (cupin superfamily)
MQMSEDVLLVPPGEGATLLSPSGLAQWLKAAECDTGGAYSLWESLTLPHEGPQPHIHANHEEAFYVLSGELEMRLGERTVTAGAGTFVLVPRGTVHAFTNHGPEPARMLTIMSPPMDRYRAALTDLMLALPDGTPRVQRSLDPAAVEDLMRRHGVDDRLAV